MTAIRLYESQRRWMMDPCKFAAAMFSRQIGKTFSATLGIVDEMIDAEIGGGRCNWMILSRGERQAKEAIEEGVKRHLSAYQIAFQEASIPWEGAESNALEVRLPNGSKVTAVPANPDTARGFSRNVLLDEFAFHRDSRSIWGALFPVISKSDLKLRVISTPNGKGNKFYELMTQGGKEEELRTLGHVKAGVWSLHYCDIYQAVEQGLDRDIPLLKAGLDDDELWAQEFELQWLDESHAWISYDLINAVEHEQAGKPELYQGNACFTGEDIARRRDLFVLYVFEQIGDVLWEREIISRKGASFAEQDALRAEMFGRYKVVRHCMDQTGIGEKPVEDAKRAHGESRVEGILFTAANKQLLATDARQAYEDRKLRMRMGDAKLRQSIHSLKRIVTPTGNFRFDAERDEAGHADEAWAQFLAIHAASSGVEHFAYDAVVRAARTRGGFMQRAGDDEDDRNIRTTGNFRSHKGL